MLSHLLTVIQAAIAKVSDVKDKELKVVATWVRKQTTVPVADLVVTGEYLLPLSLVVASFLTAFFASVRTSDQLLSQPLISFSWNNVL